MENETSDAKVPIIERHKEIDLIQSCINRMAQNSFQVKGWTVALFAVILALLPEKVESTNKFFLGVVMLAVSVMFWYLDSFFLAAERNYRKIYGWVLQEREKGSRELLYELNFKEFESKESLKGTAIWETAFFDPEVVLWDSNCYQYCVSCGSTDSVLSMQRSLSYGT